MQPIMQEKPDGRSPALFPTCRIGAPRHGASARHPAGQFALCLDVIRVPVVALPDCRGGTARRRSARPPGQNQRAQGQRTFAEWHDYLDNPILADAILDRMSQQAYKIQLKGNSKRRSL